MFPSRIFLQIWKASDGLYIRETAIATAGDLETAARSVDDDTVAFRLLEDGVLTDASEDVAREWWRLFGDEVEFDGNDEATVPRFIREFCSEQIDELYGELETARTEHYAAQRDYYSGLGV